MIKSLKKLISIVAACTAVSVNIQAQPVNYNLVYDGKNHNYTAESINITIDGAVINPGDVPPVIIGERTLVPARTIFEYTGCSITWNEVVKETYITDDNNIIIIPIDKNVINKNGTDVAIDVSAKIINDRTMIPARAVAQALDYEVDWDNNSRTVIINTNKDTIDTNNNSNINNEQNNNSNVNNEQNNNSTNVNNNESNNYPVSSNIIQLTDINIPLSVADNQVFTINTNGVINYYDKLLVDSTRLAVDIYDCEMVMPQNKIDVNSSIYVGSVRMAQFEVEPRKITRVVFDMNGSYDYELSLSEDKKSILVRFKSDNLSNTNIVTNPNNSSGNTNTTTEPNNSSGNTNIITEPNNIDNIIIRNEAGVDKIIIEGDRAPVVNLSKLTDPERIVIDIPNSICGLREKPRFSGLTYVEDITTSQYTENSSRIVLETKKGVVATSGSVGNSTIINIMKNVAENLSYNPSNRLITLSKEEDIDLDDVKYDDDYRNGIFTITLPGNYTQQYGTGMHEVNDTYLNDFVVGLDASGNTQFTFSQKQIMAYEMTEDDYNYYIRVLLPREKYSKAVLLDAGHGKQDPGTNGNGVIEKDINLAIALKVYDKLQQRDDIKVYITREDDSYPENRTRAQMANQATDIFVSIHQNSADTNSSKNPLPNGTETLYKPHSNEVEGKLTSFQLASIMQKHMISQLGLNDRGLKLRDGNEGLLVLNQTTVPAVIIETCFLSNPGDASKIMQDSYQELAAQAIYDGIVEALSYPTR